MKRLLILALLVPTLGFSQQQYVAEAPLSEVKKSGFYSIPLPVTLTSFVIPEMQDIRIIDAQETEIPFVTVSEKPDYSNIHWTDMDLEVELRKGCCTIVTLFNKEKQNIDNFLLQVRNANVHKTGNLQGSDDRKTWYAVIEKMPLNIGKLNSEFVTEVFDFPLSNYAYYRLTINDSTTSPVNVVGALKTREDIIHGSYIEIPDVRFVSRDSSRDRTTWAIIDFDTAQVVDRLEFDVEGPHLYKRRATLFWEEKQSVRGVEKDVMREFYSFDIISGQARALALGLKHKRLFIRVDNDNNPPLRFTQVAAYQLKRSLVAYLETGRDYRIALGDHLDKPKYDLEFFKDSIPSHTSELEIGKLKERSILETPKSKTFFTDPKFIWAAIILVGALLAGMTVRMLREKDLNRDN